MENEQNANDTGGQGSFLADQSRIQSEVMTRLKNRERQRRYRARKRVAARDRVYVTNGTPPPALMELSENRNLYITCIYGGRNWKRDARRAHMSGNIKESNVSVANSVVCSNTENQKLFSTSGLMSETLAERQTNSEDPLYMQRNNADKAKLGRRDWKAEARSKRSKD